MDRKLSWEMVLYYSFSMTSKTGIAFPNGNSGRVYPLTTNKERRRAYKDIKERLNSYPTETRKKSLNKVLENLKVDSAGIYSVLFPNWQEVRELSKSGLIEIESHTINHYRLTDIPEKAAKKEIEESKHRIEQELNQPVAHFCYPDGFFSDKVKEMVKAAGYQTALAVTSRDGTKGLNTPQEDPYELKRIYISNQPYVCVFAVQVAGILAMVRNIARRFLGKIS